MIAPSLRPWPHRLSEVVDFLQLWAHLRSTPRPTAGQPSCWFSRLSAGVLPSCSSKTPTQIFSRGCPTSCWCSRQPATCRRRAGSLRWTGPISHPAQPWLTRPWSQTGPCRSERVSCWSPSPPTLPPSDPWSCAAHGPIGAPTVGWCRGSGWSWQRQLTATRLLTTVDQYT